MKHFKIFSIITFCLTLLLVGCEKDLNVLPQDKMSKDDFLAEPLYAVEVVNSAYNQMLSFEMYGFPWIGVTSITSDDADKGSSDGDAGTDKDKLDNLAFDKSLRSFNDVWKRRYEGIYRCNEGIFYLGQVSLEESIKNRYIGRTFIMPGQKQRKKSVRNKLNPIPAEFAGKNVLLVDDSIVRGTTSLQIVQMAREAGANKVFFASASPEIRYPNIYGIDMPTSKELIAYGRNNEEICKEIGADALIYQKLEDLEASVTEENPALTKFDTSIFTGEYIVPPAKDYFENIEKQRSDDAKADKAWKDSSDSEQLDIFNI